MQTAATGRMSAAVKSGSRALESRMPEKRARPVWRRGRRKRVARHLAGGLLYLERGKGCKARPIVTEVSGEAAVAELAAFRDPFRSSLMALQESLPE